LFAGYGRLQAAGQQAQRRDQLKRFNKLMFLFSFTVAVFLALNSPNKERGLGSLSLLVVEERVQRRPNKQIND